MQTRHRLALLIALTLGAGGYALFLGGGATEASAHRAATKTAGTKRVVAPSSPAPAPRPSDTVPGARPGALRHLPRPNEVGELLRGTRQQALDMYRSWSKYPPNSRPLDEGQIDVLEPHVIPAAELRMFRKRGDGRPEPSPFGCTFQPLTHTAVEGADELLELSCRFAASTAKQLPNDTPALELDVISATVTGRAPGRTWELPPEAVTLNDTGVEGDTVAGDNVHTVRVRHRPEDWGDLEVKVDFRILAQAPNHESSQVFRLSGVYFSSPRAPARFTGEFEERLEDGSLVIAVTLDVRKAGRYRVYANLEQGEEAIGYAAEERRLAAGKQLVPLLFFGKLFHDQRAQGKFRVVDFRGHRFNLPDDGARTGTNEPDREQIPPLNTEYTTRSYALSDFSSEEWQSPRKDERLRELELLARGELTKASGHAEPAN